MNLDSLEKRGPLNAVYRPAGKSRLRHGELAALGGSKPQVLVISTTGTFSGVPVIGVLPGGYTGAQSGSYTLERGGTVYEFKNHPSAGSPRQARDGAGRRLGNMLVVVSDKKLGQDTGIDMLAEYYHPETMMLTDYYPFGSPMVGRTWQSGGYRYGFNGMQKDNEIVGEANGYDFGARLYDGRVGRWWSVDPEEKRYPSFSGYCFVANNPSILIDLNGREIGDEKDKDTKFYKSYLKRTDGGTTLWKTMKRDKERTYWFHVTSKESVGDAKLESYLLANQSVGMTLSGRKFKEIASGQLSGYDVEWESADISGNPDYSYNNEKGTWEPNSSSWENTHIVISPSLIKLSERISELENNEGQEAEPYKTETELMAGWDIDRRIHFVVLHESFHGAVQREFDFTFAGEPGRPGGTKFKQSDQLLFEKEADKFARKEVLNFDANKANKKVYE